MHIFGEWNGPNSEFCRPHSTRVENQFSRAQNMGSRNGRGHMHEGKGMDKRRSEPVSQDEHTLMGQIQGPLEILEERFAYQHGQTCIHVTSLYRFPKFCTKS